jgi:hypothetical protein
MAAALQGRGAALAILAGVVVAFGLLVVFPIVEIFAAQSDDIAQSQQMLALYQAEIASRPRLQAELAALNAREASSAVLLRGNSAALAAANMQSIVKPLIESHGGQVRSVQNLPSSPSNDLEKIDVQYDVTLPVGSVKEVAYQLETGAPYLFLDDVDIKVWQDLQTEGSGSEPPNVQLHWTIEGYRWAGGP